VPQPTIANKLPASRIVQAKPWRDMQLDLFRAKDGALSGTLNEPEVKGRLGKRCG
jgi:hypothetical protein